jgi:hypothetical protein
LTSPEYFELLEEKKQKQKTNLILFPEVFIKALENSIKLLRVRERQKD